MGKGGQSSEKAKQGAEKKEVLIDGNLYDVTGMRHPGGSVIDYYAGKGIDATQAFEQFHIRSARAQKFLQSLPSRKADEKEVKAGYLPGGEALLKDFEELHNQLIQEGFFKPSPAHAVYRLTEIFLLHAVGIYLALNGSIYLGLFIMAIGQGRCGWLMHEGGHYSLTSNITVDKYLQILLYGVGCGMSAAWWRNQHNKHHSMPQKIGHDVDLNTLPLVAFTDKVIKRIGFLQKAWLSVQAFLFPVLTTLLVALGWQFFLHPRHIVRTKNVAEAVALIARYFFWTILFTNRFGLAQSVWMYLVYNWIAANYIFLNFAVSHTHLDTVPKDDTKVDWVRYASDYTMNVHSGPFKIIDWWMAYLNFQIEHHLFPCMPQFRHPQVSPRVKALFEKHGLVYQRMDYITAMKTTFANLHKVGYKAFFG